MCNATNPRHICHQVGIYTDIQHSISSYLFSFPNVIKTTSHKVFLFEALFTTAFTIITATASPSPLSFAKDFFGSSPSLHHSSIHPLTRIQISRGDRYYGAPHRGILINLSVVAHGIENWSVIIKIEDVEVDSRRGGKAWMPGILSLYHENIMLNL